MLSAGQTLAICNGCIGSETIYLRDSYIINYTKTGTVWHLSLDVDLQQICNLRDVKFNSSPTLSALTTLKYSHPIIINSREIMRTLEVFRRKASILDQFSCRPRWYTRKLMLSQVQTLPFTCTTFLMHT